MADADLQSTVARIDRALRRIAAVETELEERAAAHAGLIARHDRLRERVGEAVARLDALIAGEE